MNIKRYKDIHQMAGRSPSKEDAEYFLKKMSKYPRYQNECVSFWKKTFGYDYSKQLEKIRADKK